MNSDFRTEDTVYFTSSDSAAGGGIDPDTKNLINTMKQFCSSNTSNAACSCFNTAISYLSDYNTKYKEWKDTTDALQADYDAKMITYNKVYNYMKTNLDNFIINKTTYVHYGGIGQNPSDPDPAECSNPNMYKCTSTKQSLSWYTAEYDWIITYSDQYKKNQLDSIPKVMPVPDPSLTKPNFNPVLSCCNNSITGGVNTVFTNIQQLCNIGGASAGTGNGAGAGTGDGTGDGTGTGNGVGTVTNTNNNRTIIIFGVVCGAVILLWLLLWFLSYKKLL